MRIALAPPTLDAMSEHATKPVQIRDVPADVVDTLQARAGKAGMSLTAYLRNLLTDVARRPSMEEWVESATDRDWGADREAIRQAREDLRHELESR